MFIKIFYKKKSPLALDPLFETYTSNQTLCTKCRHNYEDLTENYWSLGSENKLCMDVVDLVIQNFKGQGIIFNNSL